jgi:hypothetical protein
MERSIHPVASQHLPSFITAPGETDVLMVVMGVILAIAVLAFGILFLRLHSLPERMAHKSQKVQFEIVAVLCLIALFTHMHIFWIAALLLAFIELPDFGVSLGRIAQSTEKLAGLKSGDVSAESRSETTMSVAEPTVAEASRTDGHPALGNVGASLPATPPSPKEGKKKRLCHA